MRSQRERGVFLACVFVSVFSCVDLSVLCLRFSGASGQCWGFAKPMSTRFSRIFSARAFERAKQQACNASHSEAAPKDAQKEKAAEASHQRLLLFPTSYFLTFPSLPYPIPSES